MATSETISARRARRARGLAAAPRPDSCNEPATGVVQRLQGRHEAEQDAREQGKERAEGEDADAQAHLGQPREAQGLRGQDREDAA